MPLSPGTVVGNYRVLESLGSGGMGHVYKVQNLLYNRVEAMKVLRSELTTDTDLSGRFLREIQVQAALIHPNIAALHTALEIHGHLLMLMEYVEGETLEARLARGPMPMAEVAVVATQVLNALEYAHTQQVIHRDIKPANIILANSGIAKLMDFGLAAVGFDRKITRSGAVMGTLSYMSPEQVRGLAPTPQSDLYSFGLTVYEMLTGVRGIQGASDYDVMTAHLETMPSPPSQRNAAIPNRMSDVVMRAISKDSGARFASAAEFREALMSATAAAPPKGSSQSSLATTVTAPPVRAASQAAALWIGAGIGLAVVLAGAGAYWMSQSKPVEQVNNQAAPPAVEVPKQTTPVSQPKAPAQPVTRPPQATVAKKEPPPPVVNTAAEKSAGQPVKTAPEAPLPSVSAGAVPPPQHVSPAPVVTAKNLPPVVNPAPSAPKPTSPPPPKPSISAPSPKANPVDVAGTNRIIATLLGQLQAAYASRDINQVRAVFPKIAAEHEARLREFLKSARSVELKLEPIGQAAVSRDWAVVECRHWISARFSNGSQQRPVESRAVIRVVRGAGGWLIDSITFTERGKSLYPPV